MAGRRPFGSIIKLPSGRWRAYYWNEGARHFAPVTFRTKTDASNWLAEIETSIARGRWIDPRSANVTFHDYATQWLAQRSDLRPSTREDYESMLALHLNPAFGASAVGSITTGSIRSWFHGLAQRSPGRAAKCYRLLRAILGTAETDQVIARNPCRIKGAGADRVVELPIPTVAEMEALACEMPARLRLLVLLAGWCGLRRGELLALLRGELDLELGAVRVESSAHQMKTGEILYGLPKTAAGRRTVRWPPPLQEDVISHLERHVSPWAEALVFTGEKGDPLHQHVLQAPGTALAAGWA